VSWLTLACAGDKPARPVHTDRVWPLNVAARLLDRLIRCWARYDARVGGGVTGASTDLISALDRARALVPEPDTVGALAPGGTVPSSSPPWNTPAADAVYDVTEAARRLESQLRTEVTGSQLHRGGTDANTNDAIAALGVLTEAIPEKRARQVQRLLSRWTLRCLRLPAIDEAIIWQSIRMRPGDNRPPVCPFCSTPNLRVSDRSYVVMCFYPDCPGDSNETKPAFARLTLDNKSGTVMLVWDDGLIEGA